jgi:putative ABC transport system permease protein
MASFTVERRIKEIGIRKVLGASVTDVFVLLSQESAKLILVANVIAWPVAYFIMNRWLQSFAYRANISIWIFIVSAVAAMMIAILTSSYQSIKTALTNPADSLRVE